MGVDRDGAGDGRGRARLPVQRPVPRPRRQVEGDVLVELDTREERAQLAAAEAQRDLAKVTYARQKELLDQGVISRVEYDPATAQQRPRLSVGGLAEIEAMLASRAPLYEGLADLAVDTVGRSPSEIVDLIVEQLARRR